MLFRSASAVLSLADEIESDTVVAKLRGGMPLPPAPPPSRRSIGASELVHALESKGGIAGAATHFKVSENTIRRRMDVFGIGRPRRVEEVPK